MKHAEFSIGTEFTTDGGRREWRCTDIGTRIIVAIRTDGQLAIDLAGPPYIVMEMVFDEHDMPAAEVKP